MSISFDEKYLPHLMEECAEVIQAAAKCQRFGMYDRHPSCKNNMQNDVSLFEEIGDILGILDAALPGWEKHRDITTSRAAKIEKLKKFGPYGTYLKRRE